MSTIALPKKIDYQADKNPNQGKVIVEPLYPGYGITLGNSLRRVLLSSLAGAAPVGVKIKDVNHEFMTLPHLKEDILEFILNLKQLKLKLFTNEPVKLELDVHGKKTVKASDIKKDSNVEIANPDLVLGNITDMAGNLNAEIFVSPGMGYEMIENRETKNTEIGYIEMDSIFSPILSAGIKVENMRVGKMTDWERLIIDITTDGTVSPEEAFKNTVAILIDQFSALDAGKKPDLKKNEDAQEEEVKEEKLTVEPEDGGEEADKEDLPAQAGEPKKKKRGRPKKKLEG